MCPEQGQGARYTGHMEPAVSIPDDIFERADRVAAEHLVTRSELYAEALRRYLVGAEAESDGDITARLNAVYDTEGSKMDPALLRAQAVAIGDLPR